MSAQLCVQCRSSMTTLLCVADKRVGQS